MPALRANRADQPPQASRDERERIDIALAFANQPANTSAQDAEQLMWNRFGIRTQFQNEPESWRKRLHETRKWARDVLHQIVQKQRLTPQRERQVAAHLRGAHAELGFRDGRLTLTLVQSPEVVSDVALGIAMLVETGETARLRQCAVCSVFFIAEKGKHGAAYCRACQGEAKAAKNAERQRRYREKRKNERGE